MPSGPTSSDVPDEAAPSRRGGGEWPLTGLDTDALRREGWRPEPFTRFVLKVYSRCNLACDYCVIYTSADQSWRHQPRAMAPSTLLRFTRRMAEHVKSHGLSRVQVTLHGGEPLLLGPTGMTRLLRTVTEAAESAGATAEFTVQTNGTLLTGPRLDVLAKHRVRVGVSVDGDRQAHDARRRTHGGRGSYGSVMAGLHRLSRSYPHLYAGLLCTIDPARDPVQVYESLLVTRPPTVDFLLPHAHWGERPHAPPGSPPHPYGGWLAAVFDRWAGAPAKETSVRILDELLHSVLGGRSRLDWVGVTRASTVFVETDGSIHQNDSVRTGYDGASGSGLDVFRHSFDDALWLPVFAARQIGERALAPECLRCPELGVCGGGDYGHRYRPGHGYRNPSVYCEELLFLIRHIRRWVRRQLPSAGIG
jgi:uncharacterized protein